MIPKVVVSEILPITKKHELPLKQNWNKHMIIHGNADGAYLTKPKDTIRSASTGLDSLYYDLVTLMYTYLQAPFINIGVFQYYDH